MENKIFEEIIIKRFINGEVIKDKDIILKESNISLFIEGNFIVKFTCILTDVKELIIGYLYSENIIKSISDISEIDFNLTKKSVYVRLNLEMSFKLREITNDNGDFYKIPCSFVNNEKSFILKKTEYSPEIILKNANLLLEKSEIFKKTGNVHSVMLCSCEKIICFSEDIGRYNAFDKTIGKALNLKVNFENTCIYTSGRIPMSIAAKTINCKIPIIVSRSAPTNETLVLAKAYHLTVLGFARGNRLNIYN